MEYYTLKSLLQDVKRLIIKEINKFPGFSFLTIKQH